MVAGEELAYSAGVLDSDGYFSVTKYRNPRYDNPYYQAKVGVKQLWPGQALRFIARVLGGKVVRERRPSGLRPIARWERYARGAKKSIDQLLPYLRVKREQALLLSEFQRIRVALRREPELRFYWMASIRDRVRSLNRGSEPEAYSSIEQEESGIGDQNQSEVIAYLAGVMDSDGYFKIEKRKVRGMINPHYRLKIGAGQVTPSSAIELLAETFGGTLRIRGDGRKGHRPLVRWSLFDKSAVPALEALLPFLVIKAPQARLLLLLRERKARGKLGITEWTHKTRWQRPVKMRKRCYSQEQVRGFEQLYQIVKALHADSPPYTLPRSDETGSPPR